MNIKKIIISVVAFLVAASIYYGALIWFDLYSDELRKHENKIGALHGELVETAKVNKIIQEGFLENIQELESKITSSEIDTRTLVAETDKSLRETVEVTEQNLGVSIRDEVNTIHREITDLSGLLADTRLTLEKLQSDVNSMVATAAEEVQNLPEIELTLPPVNMASPKLVAAVTEEKVAVCPTKANNSNKARGILTRVMKRTLNQGSYPFSATFDISIDGSSKNVEVITDGPSDLRKAVARYVSALEWTVDEAANDCELKLKLDIE